MIDLSLIDDFLIQEENDLSKKNALEIIKNILLRINQDKIDQLKSNLEVSDEAFEINLYSRNNIYCPVFISSEGYNVNILIGVGETIYLDNASVLGEKDLSNLKDCIEDLFYLPIEESVIFINKNILSSSCIITQKINGKIVPVEYKHTHHFSFLPLLKKKKSFKYDSWAEPPITQAPH